MGGICAGFFSTSAVSGNKYSAGVYYSNLYIGGRQLAVQIVGILFSVGWSFIVSIFILLLIDRTVGLRVDSKHEEEGKNMINNQIS